jgi:hypothetical protein
MNIIVPTHYICKSKIKNLGILGNIKVVTENFKACGIHIAEQNKAI